VNVWWGWGGTKDFIQRYLERVTVQPDLALACSKRLLDGFTDAGLDAMLLLAGVGEAFKPLRLHREGLGFAGGDNKSVEQKRLMLEPFLNRGDFEWHGCKASHEWFSEEKLNEWYNRKQVVFGLLNGNSTLWHQMSNRVFETYASGTPLIFPRHPAFEEAFGFPQPYPVDKVGDVEEWVKVIQKDYPNHLKKAKALSAEVRSVHSYRRRLGGLFRRLKEMC
jgi:hypothetical protein